MAALTQINLTALRDYYFKVEWVGAGDEPDSGVPGWYLGTDTWGLVGPTLNSTALTAAGYRYSFRKSSTAQKLQDDLLDLMDTVEDNVV